MAIYGTYLLGLVQNALQSRTWKAALVIGAYAQSIDTESRWSAIQGFEITGPGYVAGGELTTLSATYNSASNKVVIDLVDGSIDFGVITAEDIGGLVIYDDTGTPSTSALLLVNDFGPVVVDATRFIYTAPTGGLLSFTII